MREKLNENNIESSESTFNNKARDYTTLITSLKEIRSNISLLEKIINR